MKSQILILGPEYKNHRGGVGAVIESHMKINPEAKFYCSYTPAGKLGMILRSVSKMLFFPIYLLFENDISIVHIHGASRGSFFRKCYYFYISKLFSKRVIYHIHGAEYHLFIEESGNFVRRQIKRVITQSDKVIVLSNWWKDYFSTLFPNADIIRIYNPISLVESNSIENNPPKVKFLFLGHISQRKGCFELIEVAKKLKEKKTSDFLIQIGGNGETQNLQKLINENKLASNVEFLGWVSGEEKIKLLQESHVYILPSYNEGLPVSILEAMSYGLPVISTKVGGIPEMIENSISGFIINPGDMEGLQDSMDFFIRNRMEISKMGYSSRKIVEKKFASNIIKEELNGLYKQLNYS